MNKIKAVGSFVKIGAIGFGGGTALIPVIEQEAIVRNDLMTPDEFKEELVLQGITPGALPLKVACGLGVKHGALFSTALVYATALVGVLLSIILTAVLSVASGSVLKQVGFIAVGISAFIAIVVMKFVIRVPRDSVKDKFLVQALILMAFALIFSCCGKLEELISQFTPNKIRLYIPELSITAILVLGVNFVLFTKFRWEKSIESYLRYSLALAVTILGILTFAKQPVITHIAAKIVLYAVIAAMITSVIIQDIIFARKQKEHNGEKPRIKTPIITIAVLFIPFVVFGLIVGLVNATGFKQFASMTGASIISVITTFGGGTAFISVAEGVFVSGGFVSNDLFWSQIVPITNALPGPLLCKMLASIWYHAAFTLNAGIGISILYSVYGAVLGITFTVVTYLAIYILFQYLKKLSIFEKLKKSILPLIAGLLVPTVLAMINSMMNMSAAAGIGSWYCALFTIVTIIICYLPLRFKVKEPIVIVGMGALSCGVLNLIAFLI